jgi:DTW domain-containing protein YfiP
VYPSKNAISIDEYVRTNGPIRRFVFIDATWYTVGSIRNQRSICALPAVILKNYETQYWRPQKGCSNTYLATIEAICEFFWGCRFLETHGSYFITSSDLIVWVIFFAHPV